MAFGFEAWVGNDFARSNFFSLPFNSSISSVSGSMALKASTVGLSNNVASKTSAPILIFIFVVLPRAVTLPAFGSDSASGRPWPQPTELMASNVTHSVIEVRAHLRFLICPLNGTVAKQFVSDLFECEGMRRPPQDHSFTSCISLNPLQ